MHRRFSGEEQLQQKSKEINMEQLLMDLKGGNGHWKQIRAKETYAQEIKNQEEHERKSRLREARRLKRERAYAAKQEQLLQEELRRNREKAEKDRQMEEEEKALLRAKQREEEHNKQCKQQLEYLKESRPCNICKGSGKCITCGGKGFFSAMYLSSSVATGRKHDQFHGRTRRGCAECGGFKKDEDEGSVEVPQKMAATCNNPITGSGFCAACDGTGKTKLSHADISGSERNWLDDIQSLMRQMRASELGLLLADKIWVIRLVAAEVLEEQGKAGQHAHKIATLLHDKTWKVRAAAAKSLGSGGPSAAPYVSDLTQLVQDQSQEVRKAATIALGTVAVMKPPLPATQQANVVNELTQLQYDKNEEISQVARDCLQRIKEAKEER